jgi:hypothetical protein
MTILILFSSTVLQAIDEPFSEAVYGADEAIVVVTRSCRVARRDKVLRYAF